MSTLPIEISAFPWVPPFAQGYVKDLRPRWALAEAGLPYRVQTVASGEEDTPAYRTWQPFGQVPAYRDGEVELFESGAIVLRIAELSPVLAPRDAQEAAQVRAWVFAALNSVEPRVDNLIVPAIFHGDEDWVAGFRPHAERLVGLRLKSLSGWLEGRDWLAGRFSVADIVMATVLRALEEEPILAAYPIVGGYLDRCLARPAFRQALDAQLATFAEHEPACPPPAAGGAPPKPPPRRSTPVARPAVARPPEHRPPHYLAAGEARPDLWDP